MLNQLKKHGYLLLFFASLWLGWFINKPGVVLPNMPSIAVAINASLSEKEQIADNFLDSILGNLANNSFSDWVNTNSREIDLAFTEKGIIYYLYLDNELIYWTNNSISVPDDTLWLKKPFQKRGNTYFEVRSKKKRKANVVALIQVATEYPFENGFLKNRFHKSYNIESKVTIVDDENSGNHAIYNNKGDYLFSLKPKQQDNLMQQMVLITLDLILAAIFLLLYGHRLFRNKKFSFIQYLLIISIFIAIRFLMQWFRIPAYLDTLPIFQPEYFAYSHLFPSIGDLLITIIMAVYLIYVFYTKVSLQDIGKFHRHQQYLILGVWVLLISGFAAMGHNIFKHLIIDSNFQFEAYDVLNLSVFSFIGYFILIAWFIGFILLIDKAFQQVRSALTQHTAFYYVAGGTAFALIVMLLIHKKEHIIPVLFIATVILLWTQIRIKRQPAFGMVVLLLAIYAGYATYFLRKQNFSKRVEESKVLAVNLAREKDPVAEQVLSETMEKLQTDTVITNMLQKEWFNYNKMADYVQQEYFTGYLGRYNFQLTLCDSKDSVLLDESTQEWAYCYGFFKQMIMQYGTPTNVPGLYYLKSRNGGVNYFLSVLIHLKKGWDDMTMYLELTSKPNFEVLGYPELLLEKPLELYQNYPNLNYAKYSENQLLVRTGNFPYAFDRSIYKFTDSEFAFFQSENFDHLLYNSDKSNTVIVSFPTIRFFNIVISFTYIFFFLFIQTILLLLVGNRLKRIFNFNWNIKNKIVSSMIAILLISLIIVGGGTVLYTYRQFEKGQNEMLSEKLQSVLVEIETKLAGYTSINQVPTDYLNNLLLNFSNVFYSDINLYDLKGNLVATSRKEIFERNLTSTKMNAEAYRELVLNKKARIVHYENIGTLQYYSGYVPFISTNGRLLAYLNLPYFTKESAFRQELMSVVVAVINIYVFLIVLSIGIAVYMSNRITEPLRLLQQRISKLDLRKQNELIEYQGKDEIAELVFEYNRMLGELDNSTKLLAKSERESAWREMAQQIAHEIKNPLTPMKLNIQLLERSWKNGDADFADRFNRFTGNLIEQIDSLSSIASAFSQFAQMPIARAEKVDLLERIRQSVMLYRELANIQVTCGFELIQSVFVKADNERMLQVFNNLIKNAIQSIPKDDKGEVSISINLSEQSVVVEISDNGIGITPEIASKLFQPNFTTKSSGTGLGLAIVKNIVEEFGGAIWFKSEVNKGTTFFVSFPLYAEES